AEDGIRDRNVTGVQTCALPILRILWKSGQTKINPAFTVLEYLPKVSTRPSLFCGTILKPKQTYIITKTTIMPIIILTIIIFTSKLSCLSFHSFPHQASWRHLQANLPFRSMCSGARQAVWRIHIYSFDPNYSMHLESLL